MESLGEDRAGYMTPPHPRNRRTGDPQAEAVIGAHPKVPGTEHGVDNVEGTVLGKAPSGGHEEGSRSED